MASFIRVLGGGPQCGSWDGHQGGKCGTGIFLDVWRSVQVCWRLYDVREAKVVGWGAEGEPKGRI